MRQAVLAAIVVLAGCGPDWRSRAIADAQALVGQQIGDPAITFTHLQVTGDRSSGQTCGYFERPLYGGGRSRTRFIAFIDGGGGRNPYIDDPSAPYPGDAANFALNWRTQCTDLGYRA